MRVFFFFFLSRLAGFFFVYFLEPLHEIVAHSEIKQWFLPRKEFGIF